MGRTVRQKRKNRSSVPKVKHKPKPKKKIFNNPIIAAHWDKNETLTQNYRRLGLSSKLNRVTGGIEKTASAPSTKAPHAPLAISSSTVSNPALSQARVERDPETGAILRILSPSPDPNALKSTAYKPISDPLNDLSDPEPEQLNPFAHIPSALAKDATLDASEAARVLEELTAAASSGAKKAPRKQSQREREWIKRLVEKHGDDYLAMARDMKLNVMQQSVGDIKRRVRKWKEAKENGEVDRPMWT